jgi:transcriptional regulator with XRE-family HTH domain
MVTDVYYSKHTSSSDNVVKPLSFGKRLRQVRERLGMTQIQMALTGGVKRTTQHLYENDVRVPDLNYLERLKEAGADIGYLILGEPRGPTQSNSLTISYALMSNLFRVVDEFCVDEDGNALPRETRLRFFQMLCVSLRDRPDDETNIDALRMELARFTGT